MSFLRLTGRKVWTDLSIFNFERSSLAMDTHEMLNQVQHDKKELPCFFVIPNLFRDLNFSESSLIKKATRKIKTSVHTAKPSQSISSLYSALLSSRSPEYGDHPV